MPRKLLRIQGKVLAAGGRRGDGLEVGDVVRAAELSSADTETAYETGLLTGSDLLHLDTDAEFLREYLDELPEVNTAVGNVVEDCLCPVALELHVSDFHLKPELNGDLPGPYHGLLLAGDGLLPFLDVELLGPPVDLLQLHSLGIKALAPHLAAYEGTLQSHYSEVVAALSLDNDHITHLDALVRSVHIEALAGILEPHFEYVGELVLRDALKPVVILQLAATAPICAIQLVLLVPRDSTATAAVELNILIVIHIYY